jgi:hypothetical protein
MSAIYATLDSDGDYIPLGADIRRFDNAADALAWAQEAFGDDPVTLIEGSFGDCWAKTWHAPKVGDPVLSPFSYNQVIVRRPGEHPGGGTFWITPYPTVFVAATESE